MGTLPIRNIVETKAAFVCIMLTGGFSFKKGQMGEIQGILL